MLNIDLLKHKIPKIDFREKRIGTYKIIIPYFHEDGDMYDIFVEICPYNDKMIRLSDYGLTLMKLSYSLNNISVTKETIIINIIEQNNCSFDNGNIYLDISIEQFNVGIYQFIQTITKISSLDILSKQHIKSMFYENLNIFLEENIKPSFEFVKDFCPIKKERDIKVDYMINTKKPIYLYGINSDDKAYKVIISYLSFQKNNLDFFSFIVCEDCYSLTQFNQRRLTNIADKQFTDLNIFTEQGLNFITRHS